MTLVESSAPGKVILFGEHAVVYGKPAIAVPVTEVQVIVTAEPAPTGSGLTLVATNLEKSVHLSTAPRDEPLTAAARLTLARLSIPEPDATLIISSTIPIASGLGSGTAVSTALIRTLASFLDHPLETSAISALAFEVEKIHHGTPSGIDNTVVAYEQPVYFVREQAIHRLDVNTPFTLLIGDTGVRSSTKKAIEHVRRGWKQDPARYNALFDQIGDIVDEARQAIETGDVNALGPMMDYNHERLIKLGVSCSELNTLVEAARFAGAMGAKLSGAGHGGNMIALVEDDVADQVTEALLEAGAKQVIGTTVATTD
ncbi:MAG: mevalonate kinase [Chloroflexi bacterium]|nr:mevalonate kinase [Chloroflexota bacterium]